MVTFDHLLPRKRESFCILASREGVETVSVVGRNWPPGRDPWKTCTVFAAIENSRQDTNRLRSICSRRPWAYDPGKNLRRGESVSAHNARSRWPWDHHRRAPSTLPRGR